MKNVMVSLIVLTALPVAALAGSYNYLSAGSVKEKIEAGERMILVDIQVEEEYAARHLPGAVATHAYPVKSDVDRQKLAAVLPMIRASAEPVVIVCPRGGGGAKRTYDYLKGQGVAEARLNILEKGQKGWPYAKMTESGV
ncbi:MAG: rhodanese-like domain-containing protein [Desulfuromonadales bacterium]|nr:rhodanese-like domain-containing protein [Desulfuromonadales bacterium]NIR34225.1 rhodanese-like domain-containing protein [Desulfuromonadales bacterium]NIS44176.1 rhodanese-like domain-containing protein [Desulfuromonadales bacterium]